MDCLPRAGDVGKAGGLRMSPALAALACAVRPMKLTAHTVYRARFAWGTYRGMSVRLLNAIQAGDGKPLPYEPSQRRKTNGV